MRQSEQKGAGRRVGLDEAADINIGLGNDAVERSDDALIDLLLLQHLDLRLLRLDPSLPRLDRMCQSFEVRPVGIALLAGDSTILEKDRVSGPGALGQLALGLGLAQVGLGLAQGRLSLGNLVVELGRGDHRERVALFDAGGDIDKALSD
jgi:hypothetical protein